MKQVCIKMLCISMVVLFSVSGAVAQVGGSHVVTTRKTTATKVKKTTNTDKFINEKSIYAPVTKGWYNTIRLQYEFLVSPGIHYQGGYRFNKMFELGFGMGYECMFHSLKKCSAVFPQGVLCANDRDYEDFYDIFLSFRFNKYDFFSHNVPLYANARVFFLGNKKMNPFIGVSAGINIAFYKLVLFTGEERSFNSEEVWSTWESAHISSFGDPNELIVGQSMGVGFLARLEFGCNFRVAPKSSVNVSVGVGNTVHIYHRSLFSPFLSIGYTF